MTGRAAGAAAAPLVTDGRIVSLDILRGCALFGMILVHFHMHMRLEATGAEDVIPTAVWMLVEQKSWGTFAFLFGVGFAIFLRRLDARGVAVTALYLRRLAALAAFGLVAGIGFGFHILFHYACWGVLLLLVRCWSTRALLALAALATAARPVAAELLALGAWRAGTPLPPRPGAALAPALQAAVEHGSYVELVALRWKHFLATTPGWLGLYPDTSFVLFLLGLLAVRHGVIDDPRRHRRLITAWMAYGAASWFVFWFLLRRLEDAGPPGVGWPLAMGLGFLQDQWLCLAYVGAGLLALADHPGWSAALAPVGNAGRMALTNYMLQSVVLDVLASGYGLGLRLRPLLYVPAAAAFFAIVCAMSSAWLARFRFGPLEWAWRSVTYARSQPLRRADPAGLSPATS